MRKMIFGAIGALGLVAAVAMPSSSANAGRWCYADCMGKGGNPSMCSAYSPCKWCFSNGTCVPWEQRPNQSKAKSKTKSG